MELKSLAVIKQFSSAYSWIKEFLDLRKKTQVLKKREDDVTAKEEKIKNLTALYEQNISNLESMINVQIPDVYFDYRTTGPSGLWVTFGVENYSIFDMTLTDFRFELSYMGQRGNKDRYDKITPIPKQKENRFQIEHIIEASELQLIKESMKAKNKITVRFQIEAQFKGPKEFHKKFDVERSIPSLETFQK